ncbi:MAG: hypothetical protein ACTSQA_06815 [Candidatus Heimdallarchaeaceae archaeon]
MGNLKNIIEKDENIWEIEPCVVSNEGIQEEGVSITVGDTSSQFEIVFTEGELEQILETVR